MGTTINTAASAMNPAQEMHCIHMLLAGGLPMETSLLAIIGCIYILLLKCSLMYIVPLQQIKVKEKRKKKERPLGKQILVRAVLQICYHYSISDKSDA